MKKIAIVPPSSLMTRCQRVLRSSVATSLPMLLTFAFLIAFTTRAIISWSALRSHGQIADATLFIRPKPHILNVKGGSAVADVYDYAFVYRGIHYFGVSTFNTFYLGEWPHAPYRVTFLPESPQINDILPVGRWYVLQKSVEPGFLLLVFAAMTVLSFTITEDKKETRSGLTVRNPAKIKKSGMSIDRREQPRAPARKMY